jgi:hypothetical protein
MRYNIKRHKVLEILSERRVKFDTGQFSWDSLGVDFSELEEKLNVNRDEIGLILASLYSNEEVEYTDVDVEGVFATQKGLSAYSESKYLNQNWNLIKKWLLDIVQIFIPVLSLLVALVAVINSDSKPPTEYITIEKTIQQRQDTTNTKGEKTKNTQTATKTISEKKKDTLKN